MHRGICQAASRPGLCRRTGRPGYTSLAAVAGTSRPWIADLGISSAGGSTGLATGVVMRNQLPRPAACVDTARPNEREEAVRLLFQHLPPHEAEPRITNALDLLRRGELDSQGLFVVRDSQTLLGAMVCQLIPGASGLVWPPQVRKHRDRRLFEDQLVLRAGTWLQRHGVK